jgi:hypothetical protein
MYGYHNSSFSETAIYRVKQLLGASLMLRNYNAQDGETYVMIKALNKLTGIGMPETKYVVQDTFYLTSIRSFAEFGNKAGFLLNDKKGARGGLPNC